MTDTIKNTPWGKPQASDELAEGITFYSTAGHGGIHLSRKRQAAMNECLKNDRPWYEEDCEWSLVVLSFPEEFSKEVVEDARVAAKNYFPYRYELAFGVEIPVEESYLKRRDKDKRENAHKLVVHSAYGSWHEQVPSGYVGVMARRRSTAQTRYFLIPAAEYNLRDFDRDFVIPEPIPASYEELDRIV